MLQETHLKKKLKHYKNTNIIVSLLSLLDLQRLIWMISLLLFEFLDAEKYRISLSLGEGQLDSKPLGRNEAGIVFKARMNGKDVALKFFLFNGDNSRKGKWLNKLKARYLEISLLETRNNIVQYADFDIVTVEGEEIPVLVMKL